MVQKNIQHIKFTFTAKRHLPPRVGQQALLMAAEERGKYF